MISKKEYLIKRGKLYSKKALTGFYIIVLSFILLLHSLLNPWILCGNSSTDSSVFKTVALYMQNGQMPYKDIFDHKGPLIYIYNFIGQEIDYWRGIWIIEFFSMIITLILLYKIARLVCNKFYACIVLLISVTPIFSYFQGGNFTEEYAMPYIAAATLIFIDFFLNNKISNLRLIICGITCGAVLLLRANMIAVWGIFCLAVLWKCLYEHQVKKIVHFILYFMIGIAIIVIPVLIWLVSNGAFKDFVDEYIIFNILYTKDPNRATLKNRVSTFVYFFNNIIVLFPTLITIYLAFLKRDIFHISYLFYTFISFIFISMSGMPYDHYGMVLIPMIIYPLANAFTIKTTNYSKNTVAIGITFYIFIAVALPVWIEDINYITETYTAQEERMKWGGMETEVVNYIIENTTSDDRIVVWGNWDLIYARSKRLCSSKYSYTSPIIDIDEKISLEYYANLIDNPPSIIIAPLDQYNEKFWNFIKENNYKIVKQFTNEVEIYAK